MKPLSDFRPIFIYEFKLNQSAAETTRKMDWHLAMILLMNALFNVCLRNFIPEILASKISPEVVDLELFRIRISGPWWKLTHEKLCVGWWMNWGSAPMQFLIV